MVRKEFNCVRDADGFSCRDAALIVMVMMVGWSNVESLGSVGSPGWAFIGAVGNNDFAAHRSEGSVIENEIAVDLCVGGNGRVDAGRPQEIQCDDSLGDKKIPKI